MEETISLKELLETLKKRIRMILGITFAVVFISALVSYFVLTPIYEASTQILVNQAKNEQSAYNYNEVQTNLQLINTYNVIITSPAILDPVVEKLDGDYTTSQLHSKITVGSEKQSQVVNITVQDEDPQTAAKIANTIAEEFKDKIVSIMNIDNVSILSPATVMDGQAPVKPKPLLNVAIALVVGLMLGVGLAFLLEYIDNTIKTEQDVEKLLEMPVLGAVAIIGDTRELDSRAERKLRA
ncbi:Wzz/FepE/Etk N-terminal domain-containing protein [Neobacillus sp. YIM B06451]|uniref:YveK family protein n=1 Tax=Neobacillus sp. YIM B06451 TaxID=3070994 RepID=UPI00293145EB|nr:Wzz/FepE/Etk N-terminal domain-containing protein [Neobacillus sp. YIM B06451]